ncbi:MAG: beta strand repeat-containing protein, partial [Bacteroidota bacterium]
MTMRPKNFIVTKVFFPLLLGLIVSTAYSQTTSINDGAWDDPNTWDTGIPPDASNSTGIIIDHIVNIPAAYVVSIDEVTINGTLTIDNTATVTIANGAGNDLTLATGVLDVSGTLILSNSAAFSGDDGGNITFLSGSTYRHMFTTTQGVLPLATWDANSTIEIAGYTTGRTLTSAANWSQNFGHFVWNCTAQAGQINLAGLVTDVQGNFTVLATNTRILTLSTVEDPVITIPGTLTIQGNSRVQFCTTGVATVVNVGGNFVYNSTNASGSAVTTAGNCTVFISGDFTMNATGGILSLGSSTSGIGTMEISGNFDLQAGTLRESAASTQGVINFNSGNNHTFANTGTISGTIDYYIGPNDVLDVGTSSVIGANGTGVTSDFVLDGTLRVGSLDALGAIRNVTSGGNIRTPLATRTYNTGSTIVYDGAAAQFIGNGHPTTSGVNTVIDNASGVSLASDVTIGGDLTLTSGDLNVNSSGGARALTLGGNINANSNFITFTGSSSDLTINGSGDIGAFPFTNGAQSIRHFTLNRSSGSVTFAEDVTLTGVTTLSAGDLIFNGQTLTFTGNFSSTGGFLSGNSSSVLTINGGGAFGTLVFNIGGSTINTFNFNRTGSGTATVDGNLTITTALSLTSGDLTNNSGLALGNGATLTRNSGSQLLGSRVANAAGNSYNVTYTGGSMTTGLELPDPTDGEDLNNLTINGGTVTLNQNITINGTMTLSSSTLNGSTFTITMQGSAWNDDSGDYNPQTSSVIFDGTTTVGGTSTPQFGNIQLLTGRTLTLPAGNVNVSGNLQVDAGSTLNASGGTITLNGSALQSVAGGGHTFNNLTINKTGGSDVQLTSSLSLTGVLNVSSTNSDFNTGGVLTLISTSDATSGNASVAALLNGTSVTGNVIVQRYMSG